MNNELINSFNESIFEDSIEIGTDFLEATIDSIIDNPIFEAIPFFESWKSYY